jgi:hypothetical protein
MAVGDKQKLITEILQTVLKQKAETDIKFEWFVNKHLQKDFCNQFQVIEEIFNKLNGNKIKNENKQISKLQTDAYFGGDYNFLFEFDEFQHFSSYRKLTFDLYPKDLRMNFDLQQWKKMCELHSVKADKYRYTKQTKDFDFNGGRTAQRAYLDCFRDLLPQNHGLQPTIRINEFEVIGIERNNLESCKKIEKLIAEKLQNNK